jgi:hypothetical protein
MTEENRKTAAPEIISEVGLGGEPGRAIVYRVARQGRKIPRLADATDVLEVFRFYGAIGASAVLPGRVWEDYARIVSGLRHGTHRRRSGPAFGAALRAIFGDAAPDPERTFRAKREQSHRRRLMVARELTNCGPEPDIDFDGAERLRDALARGKGAIVWAADTYPRMIVSKRALWQAGFRPLQVTRIEHGFGNSQLAMRLINPLVLRAEDQYLAGRIVFAQGEEAEVTRRILRTLGEGGLVLITNNTYSGSVFMELPFGVAGYMSLPTATLNIAARHGVPVFSLATVETEPFRAYRAELSEDVSAAGLPVEGRVNRSELHAAMARIALPVRDHLLATVRQWPEQFRPLGDKAFHASRFPERRGGAGDGSPVAGDPPEPEQTACQGERRA